MKLSDGTQLEGFGKVNIILGKIGKINIILGKNGSGKSILLRKMEKICLRGLRASGTSRLNEEEI